MPLPRVRRSNSCSILIRHIPVFFRCGISHDQRRWDDEEAEAEAGAFQKFQHKYHQTVNWSLNHYRWFLAALVLLFAANAWLYTQVPTGLLPDQDTGQLNGFVRGDDGFSFQINEWFTRKAGRAITGRNDTENTHEFLFSLFQI